MQIDISREPPADIYQGRTRYLWIAGTLLALAVAGGLLAAYAIFSTTPYSERLENAALALIAGPGLLFAYFGEKLQAYKRLNPAQEKELAAMARLHPEIAAYCGQVAKAGRAPVLAEFEACQARAEQLATPAAP